jgi:hypothetical protein
MTSVEVKEDLTGDDWLSNLYRIDLVSEEELKDWVNLYSYKGFNRAKVLSQLKKKFPNPKEAAEVIVICSMKGPQRAATTIMKNGKSIESQGIPASRVQGTDLISCQRITAATADLAAFYLKRMNFPKRLNIPCPAWLQFPSAGSITLPKDQRINHIEFSKLFSPMIGGVFNEQIYQTMMDNSYLDTNLRLFEEIESSTIPKALSSSLSSSSSVLTQPKPKPRT